MYDLLTPCPLDLDTVVWNCSNALEVPMTADRNICIIEMERPIAYGRTDHVHHRQVAIPSPWAKDPPKAETWRSEVQP